MTQQIHSDTRLGAVHITVSDIERSLNFYQQQLGFHLHDRENGTALLGAGKETLLVLTEKRGAQREEHTTGLYHFAVLVPSRFELAQSLRRIVETQTQVQGFADHLVSEAIYLPDPDGNGIEIYRDRPRADWKYRNGQLEMATDPLDLQSVLDELSGKGNDWEGLHSDTCIGHIHLHVANIEQAEAFYHGALGFDHIMRYGPSATFLSAGGYHHHIGANTWAGVNAPTPSPDSVGLRWFTIQLPDDEALQTTIEHLETHDIKLDKRDDGIFLRDPSQNGVMLQVKE